MADRSILLISGEYPPDIGGVGDYTRQLALALRERGWRAAVLGSRGLLHEPHQTTPESLPRQRITWRAVDRAIAQIRPSIVHVQYQTGAYHMRPSINLLPWHLRRRRSRPRIVVTAHDLRLPYLFPKAGPARGWVTARLLRDADSVVVTNAEDAQRLRGSAVASRDLYTPQAPVDRPVAIIPIGSNVAPEPPAGYDRAAWRERLGIGADDVLIVYFGLLSRTKGVIELLRALENLPSRFRLLIVGGAAPQPDDQRYAAEILQIIADQRLAGRVTITGPRRSDEVSADLLAADLGALPFADGASYRRGSLLALLQHGVPTITTRPAQPIEPPLIDRTHALLIDRGDPGTLRAAIDTLADNPAQRRTIGTGARVLAEQFGWPQIAAQHEALYSSLLE